MTWDFSHHALVKHLAPEAWVERLLTEPENVARAQLFHFRPFSGQHAQVSAPVGRAARPSPEYATALAFFGEAMRRWRAANRDAGVAREMWACPEVGPLAAGYALSGDPEPWAQARRVARDLRRAWSR